LVLIEENEDVDVIENKELNKELKTLASLLSSDISDGNEQIASDMYHAMSA
jgi:hypothetical protein